MTTPASRMPMIAPAIKLIFSIYQHDPEAVQAILSRYRLAQDLAAAVEAEVGQPIELIMEIAFAACGH